jgi:hypothetical protein
MAFRWKQMDYISDIDQQFAEWDKTHVVSQSQKDEIAKHAKIAKLRDEKVISSGNKEG